MHHISPDFKAMGDDEVPNQGHLSLAGLSIHDGIELSRFSALTAAETFGIRQGRSPLSISNLNLSEHLKYSGAIYIIFCCIS